MEWAKVKELANPSQDRKEIFKNAPTLNKNKIHHSGQRTLTTEDRTTTPNSTLPNIAGTLRK
jgi:hypothetical protein